MRLKKAPRRHQKGTADKRHKRLHAVLDKKTVAEQTGSQHTDQHGKDQNIDHRNLRQKTSDHNIRAQIPIVGEFISVASPSKPQKIRKDRSLGKTGISQRLRQLRMLAHPVRIGPEDRSLRHK